MHKQRVLTSKYDFPVPIFLPRYCIIGNIPVPPIRIFSEMQSLFFQHPLRGGVRRICIGDDAFQGEWCEAIL